jgi:two-component system, OmpR family, sensor kinase
VFGFARVRIDVPTMRTVGARLAVEGGLVLLGALLVAATMDLAAAPVAVDPRRAHDVLGLLAAGAGAAAVGLGTTAGLISGNRRASWLIPALALYCLVVIPATVRAGEGFSGRPAMLAGCLVVAVLLLAAIRPPRRTGAATGWLAAIAGALLTLAVGVVDAPGDGVWLLLGIETPVIVIDIMIGWFVVSAAVVVAGFVLRSPPLWRIGLGFGVIAIAHVERAVAAPEATAPSVTFAALRLLGVVVILLGMAHLLHRVLAGVLADQFDRQETVRLAVLRAENAAQAAAEREHELRNGLAGLAGLGHLLARGPGSAADRLARAATLAELHRLNDLLDVRPRDAGAGPYDATEAVEGIVELWRLRGMPIEASVAPGLAAEGRPEVLPQVLSNLLTNCARHAPAAIVRVDARRCGGDVLVRVRNDGGIPDGGGPAPGLGIGLDLSRRLLRAQGGDLRVQAGAGERPGWSATIRLAAAPVGASAPSYAADRLRGTTFLVPARSAGH